MAPLVGNRYELFEKIGEGGMGAVYRGFDMQTQSPVAIKQLDAKMSSPDIIERFKREGEALRQLDHPNIVKMLNAIQLDGNHYLIMDLVEGGTLEGKISQSSPLPLKQILNVALDLADALTRAHRLNIIHRDIKPSNVLLAKDGTPRLTDFGIARFSDSKITGTGVAMGTINYIAPEILQGQDAEIASDIWSMGVTLYEMVSGQVPFTAPNIASLMYNIVNALQSELDTLRPDAPIALIDLINRMMMKNPAERIPSMRLVGAELEVILSGERPMFPSVGQTPVPGQEAAQRFATSSAAIEQKVRNNLPTQTSPFVGREHELTELEKLLRESANRLLTVVAPGGMGKTRLALELGNKMLNATMSKQLFEYGVYFIDLAPLTSPETIVQAVAESLSYQIQQDGRDAKRQILDFLREKRCLLIMDNFEHVIAGRTLVQDILQAAPGVKILATSRERLSLSAETVFILSGMDIPDWKTPDEALNYGAVQLFLQSARRVRPDFELETEDLRDVARICRKVQGTPLGIVLAATWIESLELQEIAHELDRSIDFLETTNYDIPERQRSMRAVFEYSWHLLSDQERDLLPRFFMFRGGFTREAAQAIAGANLRLLNTFMTKSLLRRDNVTGRYDLHELLRQFLEEKARETNNAEPYCDAHSRYYSGLVAQLTPRLLGTGQLGALDAMEVDFENIRMAWMWMVNRKDAEGLATAIEGIYWFLTYHNRWVDAQQLFGAARKVWPADSENAGLLAGQLLVRFPDAEPFNTYQRGLAIAEQHGDAFEIAFCVRLVGHWLSHRMYNQPEGVPMLERALNGFRALNNRYYIAVTLDDLAYSQFLSGQLARQSMYAQESLAIRREIGDRIGTANSLRSLGSSIGGFFDATGRARTDWQEAKMIAYEMKDRSNIVWNAVLCAANFALLGEYEQAQTLLDEATPHAKDMNDPVAKGTLIATKGLLLALRDANYPSALAMYKESNQPESKSDFHTAMSFLGLGIIACGLNDPTVLAANLDEFLHSPFSGNEYFMPMYTPCIIYMLTRTDQYQRAAELLGVYFSDTFVFQGISTTIKWGLHWNVFSQVYAELETHFGKDELKRLMQQGTQGDPKAVANEAREFLIELVQQKP